jgi:5-methylcytosine-specific restriction endonuclease McrA
VSRYSLSNLPDPDLLRALRSLVAQDRATTASLLAHLAEVDARKLYLPAAHPSMFSYCVHELRLSEDAAYKRIQAARVTRRFPAIFPALAEGRLNLTGVLLLAPYLTAANVEELLGATAGRTKPEIEEWLARHFPRSELLPLVTVVAAGLVSDEELALERVGNHTLTDRQLALERVGDHTLTDGQLAPERVAPNVDLSAPGRIGPPSRVVPVAPQRYALQLTIGQATHDKLRHAQALLGHQLPAGEIAEVLDRALDALIARLERRKFAATSRPRPRRRPSAHPRHVPAEVRRAVWERDGGRCTFVSEVGRRCAARERLEFDHVEPVACGGRATVQGIRLRCRAHNQYAAELAFGVGFMSTRREAKRRAAEQARARATAAASLPSAATAAEEVVPWLRALGLRLDEARLAAERCGALPGAPLEERVLCALAGLARPGRRGG